MKRALATLVCATAAAFLTSGCSSIPKDVDGSLADASGKTLVVGVSEHLPYIDLHDDGAVTGTEAELVKGYADSIDAQIKWVTGNEEQLANQMSENELDLMAAGLTKKSPWTDKIAMTRPYASGVDVDGTKTDLVLAVPMGENALMVSLEHYLAERGGELK